MFLTVDIEASCGAVALVSCRARTANARAGSVGAGNQRVTAAVIGQALAQTALKQHSTTQRRTQLVETSLLPH